MSYRIDAARVRLLVAAVAVLAAGWSADARAAAKPNLVVSAVSEAPASLSEGATFTAFDTVRNSGRGGAAKSAVRYYLTTDAKRSLRERKESRTNPRTSPSDVLLVGAREIGALGAGRSSAGRKVKLEVPLGTPAGTYQLLACADDRGAVDESREDDNCKVAKRKRELPGGTGLRVDAFSDTLFPPDAESLAVEIDLVRTMYCTPAKAKPLSLKAALASIRKKLPKAGWAQFAKSPSYEKAALAERSAGAAIIRDAPGAALAALVRAHELEPREASHLINAAGVANSVGMPAEALALADAGAVRDDRDLSPMGISRQAVALTNRGNALVQLGRFKEAGQSLAAAQGIEPLLSEAASGLAAAQACTGQDPIPAFRRSQKRQPEKGPLPPPEDEPPVDADEQHAKETQLRRIQWPALPINSPAFVDFIKGFEARETAALQKRIAREKELRDQLASDDVHPLHRERREAIISYAISSVDTPRRRELQSQFFDAMDRTYDPAKRLWVDGQVPGEYAKFQEDAFRACENSEEDSDVCLTREIRARCIGPTRVGHQEWLDRMSEAEAIGRELVKYESRRSSAVAANLKDPRARELVELSIEANEASTLALLTQSAAWWNGNVVLPRSGNGPYWCIDTPLPPEHLDDPGESDAPASNPCQEPVKSFNALWEVGPVTLKANCEEIALEGSSEGFFQAFGEIKYDFRGNKITVFGGAKAEAKVGPLKGDFKSGIYVQVGMDGIQDVGWRVGPSVTAGGKVAEFNPSDMIDFSFVSALGGASR